MTLFRLISIAVLSHMVFVSARMTASLYALANNASTFTVGVILALTVCKRLWTEEVVAVIMQDFVKC